MPRSETFESIGKRFLVPKIPYLPIFRTLLAFSEIMGGSSKCTFQEGGPCYVLRTLKVCSNDFYSPKASLYRFQERP